MREIVEKIEPRMLLMMMAGIVLLISVLLVSSLVVPEFKEYRSVTKAEALLESTAKSGNELKALFAATQQEIDQLEHTLHGEMADLPLNQLESFIIGKLQKISWQNGIELVSVRPGKGEEVQKFKEILFDVELSGKYFDFFKWLNTLSQDLGLVVIKTCDIAPSQNNESDPELIVRLTMVSYRAIEP